MGERPERGNEATATEEQSSLFDAAFDLMKAGYEKTFGSTTDTAADQALTQKGALPALELAPEKPPAQADNLAKPADAPPKAPEPKDQTPEGVLGSPTASQEEKLQAAFALAESGKTKFVGDDGRKYDVSITDVGNRQLVSIHTMDGGSSHAVLRGIVSDNWEVSKQLDSNGQEVPYASKWAETHLADSDLLKGPVEGSTEAFAPGDVFLRKHGDLKLSPTEEAEVNTKIGEQKAKLEERTKQYEQAKKELEEMAPKVDKELADAGVKDYRNQDELIEQLRKVEPAEKRQELAQHLDDLHYKYQNVRDSHDMMEYREARIHKLEEQLKFSDDLKAIDKLPPEKQKVVYESLDKILDTKDTTQTTGLSPRERQEIARDVVHQIAHPEDIKQGSKDTCALASTEYVLAKDHPEVYARAVAELSTKGELTTLAENPGKPIKISDEEIHNDDGNPERTLASKIFQTGAAELAVSAWDAHYDNYMPGDLPPEAALTSGKTPVDDSGERLVINRNGTMKTEDWPGLYTEDQVRVLNQFTGADSYESEKLYAKDSDQLTKMLGAEAAQHGYPIKMSFLNFDGSGHVVNVTGIDTSKSPPMVTYEDSAEGRGKPSQMPMDKLYDLALKGGSLYAVGGQKLRVLATGDTEPYVQIIHKK